MVCLLKKKRPETDVANEVACLQEFQCFIPAQLPVQKKQTILLLL